MYIYFVPTKRLTKKQLATKRRSWITNAILKSMRERDKIYRRFIKEKSIAIKMTIHEQYKTYHNQIVELTKASKSNYFQKFFYENKENSQNMWKGINELIGKSNEKRNPEIHFQYCE